MIKPYDNGGLYSVFDSLTHKFLISDTTLTLFIPPQVSTMTLRLRQICGCDICIVPNDMQIDLNRFRTKLVTYLQYNYVGRNTRNSEFSTTSATHYKDTVFYYG